MTGDKRVDAEPEPATTTRSSMPPKPDTPYLPIIRRA
jgi:hypothetical protein